ncbi:hypothetical protein GBF38_010468 [Nibea albiflora]|uniref:Uncharacterized protein n=1 Tax=Nibea albiflora TaxID=240163 RepID=A0ACB7F3J1_NIBAL|nr:hypothetical protein GBF38_010468 [Nibea albiflora]
MSYVQTTQDTLDHLQTGLQRTHTAPVHLKHGNLVLNFLTGRSVKLGNHTCRTHPVWAPRPSHLEIILQPSELIPSRLREGTTQLLQMHNQEQKENIYHTGTITIRVDSVIKASSLIHPPTIMKMLQERESKDNKTEQFLATGHRTCE